MDLKVLLTRVVEPYLDEQSNAWFYTSSAQKKGMEKAAEEYLNKKAESLRQRGVKNVETRKLTGRAASKIIELAGARPESFVAISTHGRSGLGRWALGSVADKVARHADVPVLVIRATG
jgi:nucleotide-binding universal stress UspA family protein